MKCVLKSQIIKLVSFIILLNSCKREGIEIDSCENDSPYLNSALTYGCVQDIDGNQYATIKIGTQTWMAENLKTSKYNDGTAIAKVTDDMVWENLTFGAWCNYDNNNSYNTTYGKLYNWYAVNTGKLCPKGWHIPTDEEWYTLADYIGLKGGGQLKSTSSLWESPNTGATNSSGFSAIPAGSRIFLSGITEFSLIRRYASFWSSKSANVQDSYDAFVAYDSENFSYGDFVTSKKNFGNSCRCLKD